MGSKDSVSKYYGFKMAMSACFNDKCNWGPASKRNHFINSSKRGEVNIYELYFNTFIRKTNGMWRKRRRTRDPMKHAYHWNFRNDV